MDTQEAIFGAAVKLFSTRGFHAVSMNDIAKEAMRNKATTYHYYANKEVLFEAVLTHAIDTFNAYTKSNTLTEYIDKLFAFSPTLLALLSMHAVMPHKNSSRTQALNVNFLTVYKHGVAQHNFKLMDPALVFDFLFSSALFFHFPLQPINQSKSTHIEQVKQFAYNMVGAEFKS